MRINHCASPMSAAAPGRIDWSARGYTLPDMDDDTARPFLVIGGTGVFGRRLAEGLVRDGIPGVTIAGRTEADLRKVAQDLGCKWCVLDRASLSLESDIAAARPFAVVDASGPFQVYSRYDPFRLACAAISAGAHYFDLSDDAAFTTGISVLQADALAAGVSVLSGVSSVPALSAAAVHALSKGLSRTDLIDSMILPGNRAPRGRSVMAAILEQAGRPLPGSDETAWIGSERVVIQPPDGPPFARLASPIGAPDLLLMPAYFRADEVRFRAGLELGLMHRGLELIAQFVRLGVFRNARFLLKPAHLFAGLLERFGSDVGAMRVLVRGTTDDGLWTERSWTMVAKAGDGPHVPAIPGRILARKLIGGDIAPGARPCLGDLSLAECEGAAPERALAFRRHERAFVPLFREILGTDWKCLPGQVQRLHEVSGVRRWTGIAEVQRGGNPVARAIAALFRFPPDSIETPVSVTMKRRDDRETWTRDFGGRTFLSRLGADDQREGRMWERFGPFSFAIDLVANESGLMYPVTAGRLFGVPLPRILLPRSDTSETVDAEGRVTFDVALSVPIAGQIVRYRGWLTADQPMRGDHELPAS